MISGEKSYRKLKREAIIIKEDYSNQDAYEFEAYTLLLNKFIDDKTLDKLFKRAVITMLGDVNQTLLDIKNDR